MRSRKKLTSKEQPSAVEELRAYAKARQEEDLQKNEDQDPWLATPLPFLEFCRSDEQMAFPELSDKQKELCIAPLPSDPKKTFDRAARLYDIVAGMCGKGGGKDSCAALLACFIVYLLLNLRQAHGFLTGRHIEGEPIDILLVAPRGRTSEKVTFEKIKQRVLNWKWLREKYRVRLSGREITAKDRDGVDDITVEIGSNSIVFPGNIRIFALNSSQESAEGFNVICFICTEFAAFVNTDDRPNADKIYRTLYTSANTRFPGRFLGILISYPRYDGDAIMQMIEEAKTNKRIFPMVSPSWEFNPTLKESDFAAEFTSENPKVKADALAKYACKPGAKATRYISHPDRILSCISDRPMIATLEPFEEIVNGRKMGRLKIAKFNLHRQPDSRKYVARVDLGEVRDRAALCLAHLEGPRVVIDLLGHWVPDELTKRVVDVDDPANLIIQLRKQFCNLVFCTFDRWNSASACNRLNRNHITTDRLSLKGEDYGLLLTTLYGGMIDIPKFDPLTDPKFGELFHLNIDVSTGKVDHEEGFHNDLTECLCGVVTMLKGIRKNVDEVASDMGNVSGNLATVSNNLWSDGPTEALEISDVDEDDFSGGFMNTRIA